VFFSVNFYSILLAKPHAAVRACVLWLLLIPFSKLFKQSMLPFTDFATFVSQFFLE
jgi:hypothetical protein